MLISGAIAAELESLDKHLRLFRDMFMEDRLINIEEKLHKMARHVAETHAAVQEQENGFSQLKNSSAGKLDVHGFYGAMEFIRHSKLVQFLNSYGNDSWGWEDRCCVIVNHLSKYAENNNIGVACIYLNHKETDAQTPFNLLAAVWRQLVWSKPIAPNSKVQRLFRAYSEKRTKPDLTEIYEILRSVVAQWNRVYIVIDALDETPDNNRQTLLDYLANLGPTVCLMLTSRPNISLPKVDTETIEIRVPDADIQTYVKKKKSANPRASLRSSRGIWNYEMTSSQKSKAERTGCFCLPDFMSSLLRLVLPFPTSGIHWIIYPKTSRPHTGKSWQGSEHSLNGIKKLGNLILMWVSNAKRPLSVEELREALAVERGAKSLNPEKHQPLAIILSVCAGLVIVDQESTTVRLVHFTTHDYLDGRFPYAHTQIAHTLFTYMVFDKIENLLSDVEDPDVELADLESRMKEAEAQHALLPYCYYCFVHAIGEPEEELRDMIPDSLSRAVEWRVLSNWCRWKVPDPWNDHGWPESPSPLWVAAAANLHRTVKYLLDRKTSPNNLSLKLENGSPLCAASEYNHIQIVELLLKRGADINAGDDATLQRAAGAGNLEVVHLLLDKGAGIHAGDNTTLQAATESGKLEVMRLLLEKGADIHAGDDTTLQAAADWGELDTVLFLLVNGADIHARDDAVLREVAQWGKVELVQLLLEKGSNIHAGDDAALRGAVQMDELRVMQLLLENGANIHAKDDAALQRAARRGQPEIVQLLLENGASTHAGEDAALQEAARRGWLEIVQLLLENNADIHAGNDEALRKAHEAGHKEVFQLLLPHGADPNALQIQPEWQNIETESQTPS
ncbi:ankyrin repeat-containing domain protein [Mycena crocata]|nr:ankyrin repeat-containing domain protein [Mycena crocata]